MNRSILPIILLVLAGSSSGLADTPGTEASASMPSSQPLLPAAQTLPPQAKPLPMIARSPRSERTQAAIDRAVRFLLSQQTSDGSWNDVSNSEWELGQTALVTLALLSAGESHQSPKLSKAIEFLHHGNFSPGYRPMPSPFALACWRNCPSQPDKKICAPIWLGCKRP